MQLIVLKTGRIHGLPSKRDKMSLTGAPYYVADPDYVADLDYADPGRASLAMSCPDQEQASR